ncbi:MAG: hypothetical protein K8963_04015 [Proteobacteria bacterium]|nr:hypothetical protein [Pseudomonadota bacterium]
MASERRRQPSQSKGTNYPALSPRSNQENQIICRHQNADAILGVYLSSSTAANNL